ncbi:MAG: hypothetical protein KJ597_05020 [Nanoarchaeota archaeon]|nr:hypothetical protein [Nanoarchaeota archaeon]MBU1622907.1 hypothetical protein [Nanoarchaeota archaeon]
MNKKGNVVGIIAIILALIILTFYLVGIAQRECNSNRDCPGNAYCNTNYECVEFPDQVVVKQSNLVFSAIIIGIALIIAAYIFKGKFPRKKKPDFIEV